MATREEIKEKVCSEDKILNVFLAQGFEKAAKRKENKALKVLFEKVGLRLRR